MVGDEGAWKHLRHIFSPETPKCVTLRSMAQKPSDENDEPFGEIDAGAIAQHEILSAYIRAGFTRREAMELVKTHIIASSQGGSSEHE